MADIDDVLRRVQSLLDQADHANTGPAESQTFRAKAEQMMRKYRIEEEHLREQRAASGLSFVPIADDLLVASVDNEFKIQYAQLLNLVCSHVGVKVHFAWKYLQDTERPTGAYVWSATIVGFEGDVRMAEMLYTGIRLHFSETLQPSVRADLSDGENVYRLREAGIERGRIGVIMGWGGEGTNGPGKVTAAYKRYCAANGLDAAVTGRGVNAKTYRASFAQAYVQKVSTRFWYMRMDADKADGALVLANRDDAVNEAFWDMFPDERPLPVNKEEYTPCRKCQAAASGWCRDHKPRRAVERAHSAVGARAGSAAGAAVDLGGRVGNKVTGSTQKGIGA